MVLEYIKRAEEEEERSRDDDIPCIPHNEEKGRYSEKDISDYADAESNSSDESCIEEERNPSSSKKKLSIDDLKLKEK